LIVHDSIADALVERLRKLFDAVRIGDPRDPATLVGPLIDQAAFDAMRRATPHAQRVEAVAGGF
jgi:aldehyde dehydrogenase (NAD+)